MEYYKSEQDIIEDLRGKAKALNSLLYDVGKDVEEQGLLSKMRGDFQKWFAEHELIVAEQKKEKAEAKAKWDLAYTAKNKLTEDEVAAMRFMFNKVDMYF